MEMTKKPTFVRYGGLSSVRQKGYDVSMPTFHSPPARRGIYAFPWPYVEYFLLGSLTFVPGRMVWVKDGKGNRIGENHPEFGCYADKPFVFGVYSGEKSTEHYLATHVRPKHFNYDGDIWHHLSVKRSDILMAKGEWRLSCFQSYCSALRKEIGVVKRGVDGISYTKDHLEVFIEKV